MSAPQCQVSSFFAHSQESHSSAVPEALSARRIYAPTRLIHRRLVNRLENSGAC